MRAPRIWTVFDRNLRLVLAVSDEPGIFNFAQIPDDEVEPIECEFATLQCYNVLAEPELLNHLLRSRDVEEFLETLLDHGFKVLNGRPQIAKIARL